MSSEQNLTVENGNPIGRFDQGRNGGTPDVLVDYDRYYNKGLALVTGAPQREVYSTVYGQLVLNGCHPRTAMNAALIGLGIDPQADQFLVEENGVSKEI
jgi:hypothetical protein